MYTCQSLSPNSSHHHYPRTFPPLVSIRLFSTSVSLFLPCKSVRLHHFSRPWCFNTPSLPLLHPTPTPTSPARNSCTHGSYFPLRRQVSEQEVQLFKKKKERERENVFAVSEDPELTQTRATWGRVWCSSWWRFRKRKEQSFVGRQNILLGLSSSSEQILNQHPLCASPWLWWAIKDKDMLSLTPKGSMVLKRKKACIQIKCVY